MLIIAQDPGKKTGIATWTDEKDIDGIAPEGFSSFEVDVDGYIQFMAALTGLAASRPDIDVHFVSESFIITMQTAKNTQAGWSLEWIGVMKFIASVWFKKEITLQAPNIGKTFGTDNKLKHLGWWNRGQGHANDASRHLATYAARRGLIFDTEMLKELAVL